MDGTKVLTPQNVILQLHSSVVLWRVLAFVIDFIILAGLVFGIIYFLFEKGFYHSYSEASSDRIYFLTLILCLPIYFYSLISEFLLNGKTIGKVICKLKVIKINGYNCTYTEYLLRWIFRMIDIYPFFFLSFFFYETGFSLGIMLIGIPAFISIIITKNNQRLGDIIAGTTVIRLVQKKNLYSTIFKEISTNYKPVYTQVVKLSDNDMRIIKDSFHSSKINNDTKTLNQLRLKIEEVMQIKTKATDIEFLETVINDFNYYTKQM